MTLTWYVSDLKTGDFIEEVPLKTSSGLEATIGRAITMSVSLDLADRSCPPGWGQLFDGRRTLVVPVDDGVPLTAFILEDVPEVGSATVPLTLATMDKIAEHVYCEDGEFFEDVHDEADVAAALLAPIAAGWGFEVDVTPTGTSGDHTYSRFEDRTVASALADLSAQKGGPEIAYRIRWADETHRRFIKTIEIGPQVGQDRLDTVFEDVHLAARKRKRSWSRKPVKTIATGDGSGESRPMSDTIVDDEAIAAGVPPWEVRIPAPSIDDTAGLNRVALEYAQRYRYGTQTWELTIAQTTRGAPRLITDYGIGDVVQMDLKPRITDAGVVLDPQGWRGPARVIGWRAKVDGREVTEVTPVFFDPTEEDAS